MLQTENSAASSTKDQEIFSWGFRLISHPNSLLTMMIAQCVGLNSGKFVHTIGNAHIYLNHRDQVHTQLHREPRPMPEMVINPARTDIFSFTLDDFDLIGYDSHPAIKAPITV